MLAQEEARLLGHDYIGTEHILLGLIGEGQGVGAKALEQLSVELETARERVSDRVGRGSGPMQGRIPFTERARQTLTDSLSEAEQLNHTYIGTEHLLLGLITQEMGVGFEVLRERGLTQSVIRERVLTLLSPPPREESL